MASLELNQIAELLKNPRNRQKIDDAIAYEEKLRMHTVPYMSHPDNTAFTDWLYKWSCALESDKYELLYDSITYPLKSVATTQEVYDSLSKIFDATDANKDVFFADNREDDKELFKADLKNISGFFENEGYKKLQTNPCSFIVIDFPEQESKPEPLHYFVDLGNVYDCELKEDNVTPEYIIYKINEDQMVVIDDDFRRVYNRFGGDWVYDAEIGDIPVFTNGIPCRSFYGTVIDENEFKKGVPSIAATLGLLDWYLFDSVSEETATLNALWPVQWEYGETEDFDIYGNVKDYVYDETRDCEVNQFQKTREQEQRKIRRGHGSVYIKPYPQGGPDAAPDVGEPLGFINTPVDSLERIEVEVSRRKRAIIQTATGINGGDVIDKQALNEAQVASQGQGHKVVLQRIANQFSDVEKWTIDKEGEVRFGEAYEGSIINYGTNFITLDPNQVEQNIKDAKDAGANEAQLRVLYFQWYESKFKTEPAQIERYKILFDVEPFPTHSIAEMQINKDKGYINDELWNIKINFNTYVSRFENEFVPITSFSDELSTQQKVNFITDKIYNYGRAETQTQNESGDRSGQPEGDGNRENSSE